jgi:hypothetical protein
MAMEMEWMDQLRSSVEDNILTLMSCQQTVSDIILVGSEKKKRQRRGDPLEECTCKYCNRRFSTRRGLNRHKSVHYT